MSDASWVHWVDFVRSLKQGLIRWLDIGGLDGAFVEEALRKGIDICCVNVPEGAPTQESIARTSLASADELPFGDAQFNVVSAFGSNRHSINPLSGLKEITRVLKEGGFLLLGTLDPVYLSRRESIIPTGPPPAFWAHHLKQLGYAFKIRFYPEPSNLEVLAIKGEPSEATIAVLDQVKRDCFTRAPDIVTVSDGDLLWALREGWSPLPHNDRLKGSRDLHKKATLYLLNASRNPLQLSVQLKVWTGRPSQSLWISVDQRPLKTIHLINQEQLLNVDLPNFKIGTGGHELALESEGTIFVDGIDVACEPVDHQEFCLELPFDQYQRYKIIQEIVDDLRDGEGVKVLDIGGHPGLLLGFLPSDEVHVTDVMPCDIPTFVPTEGTAFPFEDESFDVVISVDTLEHVLPEEREEFLSELVRASEDCVILAGPFVDANVSAAEQILYDFIKSELGYPHKLLKEHREHGLPRWEGVERFLKANGLRYSVIPNGYLYNWLLMMLASFYIRSLPDNMTSEAKVNTFYNAHFYENDNLLPGYRKVVLISKGAKDVETISRKYKSGRRNPVSAAVKVGLANLLAAVIGLEQQARIEELKRALEVERGGKAALQEVAQRFKRAVKGS